MHDPDALALASMIADHLRGVPIAVEELPPSAWTLVAAYVAAHDYGPARGASQPTGWSSMGAPVRARVRARGPDGRELPTLPAVRRRPRVIDAEPAEVPPRELTPPGGNVR